MATVESVTSDNDGATITCNDDIVSNAGSLSAVVRVTGKSCVKCTLYNCTCALHVGPPGISRNLQVMPLTLASMKLTWDPPQNFTHCVQSYVAQFIHGTESTIFSTNNVTTFTVTGLTQGVHYAITVAARDGQGRTGQESQRVFYTLDCK